MTKASQQSRARMPDDSKLMVMGLKAVQESKLPVSPNQDWGRGHSHLFLAFASAFVVPQTALESRLGLKLA
jgi:hypothetical protein